MSPVYYVTYVPVHYIEAQPYGIPDSTEITLTNNGGLPVTYKAVRIANDTTSVASNIGGPDIFGYTWTDSDEDNGPTYNWVDITETGVDVLEDLARWRTNIGPFDIGFEFPFYGELYSTFRIGSQGFISFTSSDVGRRNLSLPSGQEAFNIIAPYWAYLVAGDAGSRGGCYYYTNNEDSLVMNFDLPDMNYCFVDCEIILRSNGEITIQYADLEVFGSVATTVGMQNCDGTDGLMLSYNSGTYLHDYLAVRITPGWLSAYPPTGTVEAGESVTLKAVCDPELLA